MKLDSTLFLRLVISLIGLAVAALCLIALPLGISTDQTGYYGPILIGMYIPAIPFFYGLINGFKLLGYVDKNKTFSSQSVTALKNIKRAALTVSILYALGMPYIFYAADRDDAPGVAAIGLVIIGASFVIGTAAALFQRLLQNAVDIKTENDYTV